MEKEKFFKRDTVFFSVIYSPIKLMGLRPPLSSARGLDNGEPSPEAVLEELLLSSSSFWSKFAASFTCLINALKYSLSAGMFTFNLEMSGGLSGGEIPPPGLLSSDRPFCFGSIKSNANQIRHIVEYNLCCYRPPVNLGLS